MSGLDFPMKVFLLYCKDQLEYSCDDVVKLADILTSCGGIQCCADFYEEAHVRPPNWNTWTVNKIEECDSVIMVCSPELKRLLSSGKRCDVHMKNGKFYSDAMVDSITAPKFVPVFLNGCEPVGQELKNWLPRQLLSTRQFHLQNLSEFHQSVYCPHYSQRERDQVVFQNLGFPKFCEVASLVKLLRGEPEVVRPGMPHCPIPIVPQASSLETASQGILWLCVCAATSWF